VPSRSLSAIGGGLRKGLGGGGNRLSGASGAGSYGKETRRLLEDEDFFDERPRVGFAGEARYSPLPMQHQQPVVMPSPPLRTTMTTTTITGRRTASMASVELLAIPSATVTTATPSQPPVPTPTHSRPATGASAALSRNSSRRDPFHAPARSIADSASFYSQESAGAHLVAESVATLTPTAPPVPPLPHVLQ